MSTLWRGTRARNRGLLPTATGVNLEVDPPAQQDLWIRSHSPRQPLSQNHPAEMLPDSWPPKLWEIINVCCFKRQSLELCDLGRATPRVSALVFSSAKYA